jgi:hypothetical protein
VGEADARVDMKPVTVRAPMVQGMDHGLQFAARGIGLNLPTTESGYSTHCTVTS